MLTTLYRLRAQTTLSDLQSQVAVAQVMGADAKTILMHIVLPQVWRPFCFLSGVAAVWISGDFAFSSLVMGRDLTLATTAQLLLGGYHLSVATVIMWLSLSVGAITFLIFEGIGRVGDSQPGA